MKKVGIIVAILVVIGGIAGAVLLMKKDSPKTASETKATFATYDACELLTKDKAAALLGTKAVLGQEPSPSNSDDLRVSNCVYNNGAGNFRDIASVSLLVRSPLTQTGADSNVETFNNASLVGDTLIEGYGEKAIWNSNMGQLNILKDKNWMILTFGKVQATSRTLDDAKKAADSILK